MLCASFAWRVLMQSTHHPAQPNERSSGLSATESATETTFNSAKYTPVPSGSMTLEVEKVESNYLGSGQQGALTESLMSFDSDTGTGTPSGYHFFIYNPRVHKSGDGSTDCDLVAKLVDPDGQAHSILMLDTSGKGFIPGERIVKGNTSYRGTMTGRDCGYVSLGVHSDGTVIPADVWARADALRVQSEARGTVANGSISKEGSSEALEEQTSEQQEAQ